MTTEYIYKVFSPDRFGDDKIAKLLGVASGNATTWEYRHMWKSYPYEYPRVTFENIILADGLWYTAGIESFISTMETSSLMGSNVARLVVDKWEAEKVKVEGARIEAEKEAAEKVAAAEKAAAEEVEPDQPKEAVNEEL